MAGEGNHLIARGSQGALKNIRFMQEFITGYSFAGHGFYIYKGPSKYGGDATNQLPSSERECLYFSLYQIPLYTIHADPVGAYLD